MRRLSTVLAVYGLLLVDAGADELRTWRLEGDAVRADRGDDDRPYPVGSLQKPFVARAWARAYPGGATPRFRCYGGSQCWRPDGHGVSGLSRALALSCNAYFRALAAQVPADVLRSTLSDEGFIAGGLLGSDAAIGIAGDDGAVVIRPSALLRAYRRLLREPWEVGEPVRREVLAGLREAALSGTASGIGRRGYRAKTGTVPSLEGRALRTSGWVVALDDSGWAILGLLADGTGREAARSLSAPLSRLRPWAAAPPPPAGGESVRISLFALLRPRTLIAKNAGGSPLPSGRGFVGAGASVSLSPGDRLGEGLWELSLPARGLTRRVRGSLACETGPGGVLRLRAEITRREYVEGIVRAELSGGDADRRLALRAAALRFLEAGPRHPDTDVCDATHCAWFLGRGPHVLWPAPEGPAVQARLASDEEGDLDPASWALVVTAAREPGPRWWTSHCGGEPLSPHFLWGNGDRRIWPCPRHRTTGGAAWARRFTDAQLARAFGTAVTVLSVAEEGGVWSLRVATSFGTTLLRYDEAHRRLASVLGWGALPSPARRVVRIPGGFEATGVGLGHRVGLCLAD